MISSAVIIPETTKVAHEPSHLSSLKRTLSSSPERDSKRPRLETEISANGAQPTNTESLSAVPIESSTSPQNRRRASALGVEEKKRNQRLFGTLLGTLSQATTSSRPAHKKRDEIEARQRERLQRQKEEQEEQRSRQREQTQRKRLRDQRSWNEEGLLLKHKHMRATAGFLLTKTEPRLYYLPWDLRDEEQQVVARQKEDVEARIQRELKEGRASENVTSPRRADGDEEMENSSTASGQHVEDETTKNSESRQDHPLDPPQQQTHANKSVIHNGNGLLATEDENTTDNRLDENQDRHKEDDHHGEELVEGQEDDVIY